MQPLNGPILFLEDDQDDQIIMEDIIKNLNIPNNLIIFESGAALLDHLVRSEEYPFLIISDINLPEMSGFELRKIIFENEYLRKIATPFIFLSSSTLQNGIDKAFDFMVQGYFSKPSSIKEMQCLIKTIIDYWKMSHHASK